MKPTSKPGRAMRAYAARTDTPLRLQRARFVVRYRRPPPMQRRERRARGPNAPSPRAQLERDEPAALATSSSGRGHVGPPGWLAVPPRTMPSPTRLDLSDGRVSPERRQPSRAYTPPSGPAKPQPEAPEGWAAVASLVLRRLADHSRAASSCAHSPRFYSHTAPQQEGRIPCYSVPSVATPVCAGA